MQISLKIILTAVISSLASASVLPKPSNDGLLQDPHTPFKESLPPMKCQYPFKKFTQRVNHPKSALSFSKADDFDEDGSNDTDTFDQQYQIILDHEFYRPGGPIFFVQGGESPLVCAEMSSTFLYAMEMGAMVVAIEHRFFGQSWPKHLYRDNDNDQTVSALSSLTLENVLLDSVELIKHVKSTVPGAQDSKVIAFGSSYSATLAALLRIHFSDIFFAAFASSGVFSGLVSDPRDPLVYARSNWVRSKRIS